MTRWQIIKVLLIVAYRVFVRRDYLGLLRGLLPKEASPATEPMKHHPSAMGFVPELRKMVRGGGAHLLVVLLLAGVAMAAGQITVTGFPPTPVTLRGGVGVDIVGGEIRATGVAVPISIQPYSNISTAVRGNLAPFSLVNTFKTYTSVGRVTESQLAAELALKSPVFANYTTLARFGAGPTYNGLPIASGGVAGVQTFNARSGNVLPTSGDYSIGQIAGAATVATSGSYNDLSNKPTLSTVAATGSYTDLLNKPALSTVAATGSYNDLLNKPATYTLPTATTTVLGGVKVDGTSVVIDGAGVISSTVSAGVASVDGATGVVSLAGVYKTQAAFNNFSSQQATQDAAQDTAFRNYTTNDRLTRSELSSATNSTSTTTAANSAAVKAAYDLAASALQPTGVTAGTIGDTDTVAFARSGGWLSSTWSAIKTTLKSYFDGLYATTVPCQGSSIDNGNMLLSIVAAESSGTVKLGECSYALSSSIDLTNKTYLTIEGNATKTFLTQTNANTPLFTVGDGVANPKYITLTGFQMFASVDMNVPMVVVKNAHTFRMKDFSSYGNGHIKTAIELHGGPQQFDYRINDFELSGNGGVSASGIVLSGDSGVVQDTFISDGVIASSGNAIDVVHSSGLYLDNVDAITSAVALKVHPGNGQNAVGGFITNFLADTSTGNGMEFLPAGTGKVTDYQIANSWASSGGASGIVVGPRADGLIFNGVRSINNQLHGYDIQGGENIDINGAQVFANGRASEIGAYHGINVAAGVSRWKILGGSMGNGGTISGTSTGIGAEKQGYGIKVATGASDNYSIIGTTLLGNTLGPISDGGTGTSKTVVFNTGATTDRVTGTNTLTDGTNNKTWTQLLTGSGTGTVTSVTSANADIAVATGTTTPVLTLNSGTSANQIVKLTAAGKLPAVDGSLLTGVTAGATPAGTVAGAVQTRNSDGSALAASDSVVVDTTNSRVGVGTAAPSSRIDVVDTSTITSGTNYTEKITVDINPAAPSSATTTALQVNVTTNAANSQNLTGTFGMRGMDFRPTHAGSGTVTGAVGLLGIVANTGTGTITKAYGGYFAVTSNNANGAITDAYGVYIPVFTATGTMTNRWGIYQLDAALNNYFNGNVGIGTTSPGEKLEVAGNIKASTYIISGHEDQTASYTVSKDSSKITLASATATVTLPASLPAGHVAVAVTVAGAAASGVSFAAGSGGSVSWGDAGTPTFTNSKTADVVCHSQNAAATTTAAWRCVKGGNY